MSIRSKLHFWRFTLRRRMILLRLLLCGNGSSRAKVLKDSGIFGAIGNNVFIGGRSIVLYDVAIGDNVIIGAGSVVTCDIPSGSVAVGCPAKVVGRFEDSVRHHYMVG